VYPTMTAICQDSRELGQLAYQLLLRQCVQPAAKVEGNGLGKAWLEINHTTGRVPEKPIRILPNGERLAIVA
jgi:hypothetical protein